MNRLRLSLDPGTALAAHMLVERAPEEPGASAVEPEGSVGALETMTAAPAVTAPALGAGAGVTLATPAPALLLLPVPVPAAAPCGCATAGVWQVKGTHLTGWRAAEDFFFATERQALTCAFHKMQRYAHVVLDSRSFFRNFPGFHNFSKRLGLAIACGMVEDDNNDLQSRTIASVNRLRTSAIKDYVAAIVALIQQNPLVFFDINPANAPIVQAECCCWHVVHVQVNSLSVTAHSALNQAN